MTAEDWRAGDGARTGDAGDAEAGASGETVRAAWDDTGLPSTAVVETVASATGRDPLEMDPLQESLDVDALNELLTGDRTDAWGGVAVSFTYSGTAVWVDSSGRIEVDPDTASVG